MNNQSGHIINTIPSEFQYFFYSEKHCRYTVDFRYPTGSVTQSYVQDNISIDGFAEHFDNSIIKMIYNCLKCFDRFFAQIRGGQYKI